MEVCAFFYFFFFQAEDGIRDADVTGVQTCALPISLGDAVTANSGEIAGEHVDEGLRLHLLDVGAGSKGLFAAGQENASDLVVGFEILDRCGDLAKYAEGKRVEHFGAVKGNDSNRVLAFDNDAFERAHALTPRGLAFAANVPAGGVGFKWVDRATA